MIELIRVGGGREMEIMAMIGWCNLNSVMIYHGVGWDNGYLIHDEG